MTVRQPIEEEYQDSFQNVEAAIMSVYRQTPELTDWDVEEALSALIRQYQAEWRGKEVRPAKLSTQIKRYVYDAIRHICDWRLGREALSTQEGEALPYPATPLSLEEIAAILKRIRKSVRFWSKRGGRLGYLNYVDQFIP